MHTGIVAITGATGFIGRHMVCALLQAGTTVLALHRRAGTEGLPRHEHLIWVPVADAAQALRAHRPDAVVHLATCYGAGATLAEMVDANVEMPLRVMELAAANGCALFVNTDTFFAKPAFEYAHMRPYIRSKDEFLRWAALATELEKAPKVVSARLEHVYGPGDGAQKFVPGMLKSLMANEPLALTPGDQLRDFVHVDDVVCAYLAMLDAAPRFAPGVTELQVGTGQANTLRRFVETAKAASGSDSRLDFGALPHRAGEIMHSVAETSRLRELGWAPRHDLETGLRATIAALRADTAR